MKNEKLVFKKILIAGGNSTLLVWNCPVDQRNKIIKIYLEKFEQIGFSGLYKGLPKLQMMGNELSINGTIAYASSLGKFGYLYTSGLNKKVRYFNNERITTIKLAIPYKRINNIVLLSGIGYLCFNKNMSVGKNYLRMLVDKYKLPAFGAVYYKQNVIKPYVFVKNTDSLVWETACGSGSIAASIITNQTNIIQPTGKEIVIKRKGELFTISAEVKSID